MAVGVAEEDEELEKGFPSFRGMVQPGTGGDFGLNWRGVIERVY
jgi:hypothetical protein